jgi:hypothetical protein
VLLTYDPAFTVSSRGVTFRDTAFRQKYYGGLQAAGQYAGRITDIDRAGDVSRRIGVGRANVPNDGIPRYGFSDIRIIGDRRGRGMGDNSNVDPANRQRNKHQTIHDEPPIV